jgi:plasmid stabilization system protein ParE
MGRVVWSPQAARRLREIVEYVERDSPPAAQAIQLAILRATHRLGMWPLSGAWVGARHPELARLDQRYRLVVARPYVVFYRVEAEDVYVLTVRHGAQLPPRADALGADLQGTSW